MGQAIESNLAIRTNGFQTSIHFSKFNYKELSVSKENIGFDDFTQFVLTRGKSLKDKYKSALHFEVALSFEKLIEYIRGISAND